MNFTAKKSELTRVLSLCSGIVERRNTIPVLANILLAREDNRLALTATDMDMFITVLIESQHAGDGLSSVTVPCHTLSDVVKKAASADISMSAKDHQMAITADKAKFRLGTLPAADYPNFPRIAMAAANSFKLEAEALARMLDNVKHAMSTEETRYYLNGIYLQTECEGSYLRAVATDGHRLALHDEPLEDGTTLTGFPNIILPRKAVGEVRKIIDGVTGPVEIFMSENQAAFDMSPSGMRFFTKLVDGTFPDYTRVIPKGNDKFVELNTALLQSALGRVTTVADDKSHAVKLTFDKNKVTLSCRSDDGQAEDEVDVSWEHAPFEIGFNSVYLSEALARMPAQCQLALSDSHSPAILRGMTDGHPHTDGLNLVMPMRV